MDARAVLAASTLFSQLDPEALDALALHVTTHEIKSGDVLFTVGEPADSLYTVANGRLRALFADGSIAGDIGRGEPIGEIGLLADEPRGATVYALRDSELLRIDRAHLTEVIRQHPTALLYAARLIIQRMRRSQRVQKLQSARSHRSFALIAASADPAVNALAAGLQQTLSRWGSTQLLNAETVDAALGGLISRTAFADGDGDNVRLINFLNDQEGQFQHLVYSAGPEHDAWAQRCIRQADLVLIVVAADTPPDTRSEVIDELARSANRAHVELVVLRSPAAQTPHVLEWLAKIQARSHHFLQPGSTADLAMLARQVTGRGIGLVLGGGGARGFAHIGLIRALQELQIPVDVCGGSSMGAFISALAAHGYDHREMMEIARATFVQKNYLNDYLFPVVAMIRGRKFVNRLREVFGNIQIEQMRTPFFCVSTNLTRGIAMVHDRGPLYLWLAASMAVPGFAPPIAYRGELLADGAVVNSLPTDVMQALERGPIIASDVSTAGDLRAPGIEGPDPEALFNWSSVEPRPGIMRIMFRTATLTSESGVAARAARADLYLRMPVEGIGLFDWKKLDEMSERGYHYALEKLAAIKSTLLE